MTDLERENMRLYLDAEERWGLNVRPQDWPQFVGSVLIGIFIVGGAFGLGLWILHLLGRIK